MPFLLELCMEADWDWFNEMIHLIFCSFPLTLLPNVSHIFLPFWQNLWILNQIPGSGKRGHLLPINSTQSREQCLKDKSYRKAQSGAELRLVVSSALLCNQTARWHWRPLIIRLSPLHKRVYWPFLSNTVNAAQFFLDQSKAVLQMYNTQRQQNLWKCDPGPLMLLCFLKISNI